MVIAECMRCGQLFTAADQTAIAAAFEPHQASTHPGQSPQLAYSQPEDPAVTEAARTAAAAQAVLDATAQTNSDTVRAELQAQLQNALDLAAAIDANTATPAQQRAALSLCLHGLVRLVKVVYRTYDVTA